jgi:DNA-binding NtrC family response regulator
MNKDVNILIIDDEEAILDSCTRVLQKSGYSVQGTGNGIDGVQLFRSHFFHVVLLDLRLPGLEGMEVLRIIKEENPETPVIIITGYASIDSAVETIKHGAFDYLTKPFSAEELRVVINKALKSRDMFFENISLRTELNDKSRFDMVVGKSPAMEKVFDIVRRVSATESTVLITGESGTGKELLAREIHKHSLRRETPFVVVDCGALVETLFESELFGHVKGSFTGAYETKHGRFEVANGGTIFLDEISNISMNIQAKLLRVIQEREVTRIGSTKPIKVDVRIIAATNENLSDLVRQGKFREDLFYRLSVVPIHIPPLRERKQDIHVLVEHFMAKYCHRVKKSVKKISPPVIKALSEYDWPGNIRELENTIERAVVLSPGNEIRMDDLIYHGIGTKFSLLHPEDGHYRPLEDVEMEYIAAVLKAHHGNKSQTAKVLGIDRKTLLSKIKKYALK